MGQLKQTLIIRVAIHPTGSEGICHNALIVDKESAVKISDVLTALLL